MKEHDFRDTGDFGRELFDRDDPQIEADEFAVEGHEMTDPADRVLDSIVREVKNSMESPVEAGDALPDGEFRDQEYRDVFDNDFEQAFEPEDTDFDNGSTPSSKPERQKRQRRKPIKKKGSGLLGIPHFISSMILIALVVVIGVTGARIVWLWADDLLALTKEDREVTVTISDGDTMDDIANKLKDAGLVRYPALFNAYCKLTDSREKISAGEFKLNEMYDYHALVSGMSSYSSNRTELSVMIPEGYECRQIFALLEKNQICTVAELEKAAKTIELNDFWFLDGITEADRENPYCLEGFLFPDTYNFYMSDDPERVLRKFLRNFENRFSDEMLDAIEELNQQIGKKLSGFGYDETYIKSQYLTIRDVVNVAAMIERETAGSGESATIASVIYNRLCNPNYPYLNIDATIQYALGERKANLSYEDLEIDSPYNTYRNTGLPIGPIANPGLNSLKAAVWPEDTDYYYYALGNDGVHHFSRNAEEHQKFLDSLNEDGED